MSHYVFKFRIYPTNKQKEFINKSIGCVRFVYNHILYKAKKDYDVNNSKWNYYEYKKLLPKIKQQYPFLKEANSQSLQQAIINLDRAFKSFFKKQSKFPVFKKKKYRYSGSFQIPQHFKIEGSKIHIPKLKTGIKVRFHRKIEGKIKSLTITKTASDKYYISILVDKDIKQLTITNNICGIDVGIKTFATITSGNKYKKTTYKIDNHKYLTKSEKRLTKLQRQLSRKQHPIKKGDKTPFSRNYLKYSKRVAKIYEKINSQRNDFLHKLSSVIISENQAIVVEDLNVSGMIKNHHLAKAISDVGWSKFINMLRYKAQWYGRNLFKVDRFFPSSKICSNCGYIKKDLNLSDRAWVCPKCGIIHDRDINASINLFNVGQELSELTPVERGSVDDPTAMPYAKKHPLSESGSSLIN